MVAITAADYILLPAVPEKRKLKTGSGARVLFVDRSGAGAAEFAGLVKLCCAEAARLLSVRGEISVAIVDDPEMRTLNRTYRNISRTTDVLSFEHGERGLAGDLVLSIETARRRARRYGITIEEELKKLVIHGVAHLAGHTHKRKKEGEAMRAEELRVLRAVSGL